MHVIGVDVGGHSIKAGLVTRKGEIKEKIVLMTEAEKGRKKVVSNIMAACRKLLEKDPSVGSIGVGIPGIIDNKGYITYTPNIPLSKYDLGKELKKNIKKRLFFGNDADNFALAKARFGAGKGKQTVVCLTLGTGIGSGLIINGELFSNKGAPELGHTTINFDGPKARCCGNDGCIETYIGRRTFPEGPLEVYKKALAQDKDALERFSQYGTYLGIAVSNFINIFNPDVVILGGQLSNAFDFFKDSMNGQVKKRTLFKTRIIRSKMMDAGLIGAGVLAL